MKKNKKNFHKNRNRKLEKKRNIRKSFNKKRNKRHNRYSIFTIIKKDKEKWIESLKSEEENIEKEIFWDFVDTNFDYTKEETQQLFEEFIDKHYRDFYNEFLDNEYLDNEEFIDNEFLDNEIEDMIYEELFEKYIEKFFEEKGLSIYE